MVNQLKKGWQFFDRHWIAINALAILFPFYIHLPCLLLTLIRLTIRKRPWSLAQWKPHRWPLVFILYCAVVSVIFVNWPGLVVSFLYLSFYLYMVYYFQEVQVSDYIRQLRILVLGSIGLSVYALIHYLVYSISHGYGPLYIFKYANIQTRAEATFFNANYYGLFCLMMVVIACYLFMKTKGNRRWIYPLAIACNGVSLVLTASRWIWPCLAVGLVSFVLLTNRKWLWPLLAVIGVGGGLIVLNPEWIPRLSTLAYAFEDRFYLWGVGWRLFKSQPFLGRGPMTYLTYYYLFTDKAQMHAHSIYINFLANYGLIGLVLAAIPLLAYIRTFMSRFNYRQAKYEWALLVSLTLIILTHGVMDVSIFWSQTAYVYLVCAFVPAGLLNQLARQTDLSEAEGLDS
ncbi:O-antigen ligase family protein [Hutsoniella sourekii]|uniref:O-antigen ligase family protein n=1 Tax=Hutsoniella sourekii TaxID=87650 RepID=UPI0004886F01|nr:O-antigen ligase family protein [Hutsoniella sourekii]